MMSSCYLKTWNLFRIFGDTGIECREYHANDFLSFIRAYPNFYSNAIKIFGFTLALDVANNSERSAISAISVNHICRFIQER